jgi:hypothetical protein
MALWRGEDYYLQLDSHHRFAENWDASMIAQAHSTSSDKPIITAYGNSYFPGRALDPTPTPLQIVFNRFTVDGVPLFRRDSIPISGEPSRPLRARFLSAHFLFTVGSFVKEVPYDPELYFHGEEITLAIRAYTNGYDLFHPREVIVRHADDRSYRTTHQADHTASVVHRTAKERDRASIAKVVSFLTEPYVGEFGCGTQRTFADYEAYAGISFRHRRLQDYSLQDREPPNPTCRSDWMEQPRVWRVRIVLDGVTVPPVVFNGTSPLRFTFHDIDDELLCKRELSPDEVSGQLSARDGTVVVDHHFESGPAPLWWRVSPVSVTGTTTRALRGVVDPRDRPRIRGFPYAYCLE